MRRTPDLIPIIRAIRAIRVIRVIRGSEMVYLHCENGQKFDHGLHG
jgi:hypothetical protein